MILSARRKKKFWILAMVLLVTFVIFSSALGNQFTNWDDGALLTENIDVHHGVANWHHIFTKNDVGTYIPLTILSFNIEHIFFNQTAIFYYLDNILLHLVVVTLVFILAQRLGLSALAAGFSALLFGIHPMHVESVAWIAQRKDVLYSAFYLLALLQYDNYLKQKKWKSYLWALFLGCCSILAKPMAYSLPLILLLWDWAKGRPIDLKVILEKVPFFLLIGAASLVTYTANPQTTTLSVGQCLLVWVWVFIFHLQKFVFPHPLLAVYDVPLPISLTNSYYAGTLAIFLILFLIVILLRREPWIWFALIFYFLSNSMIILRAVWEFGNNTVVADRFMYLPSLGICLVFGIGYDYLREGSRKLWIVLLSLIFMSLGVLTVGQVHIWKNNISLWSSVINHNPKKILAYQNRAAGYMQEKRYDLAMNDLNHGLQLSPDNADLYFCRADLWEKQEEFLKALNDFNHSAALNPQKANTFFRRGVVYQNLGQMNSALADYNAAIAKDPKFDRAFYNRGMIYDDMGKSELALADYTQVIEINPWSSKAYNNRAVILINQGNYELAKGDLIKAIKIDSHNNVAYDNLRLITHMKKE